MNWFFIAIGGASGALLRALVFNVFAIMSQKEKAFPVPTLVVNAIGSLLIGVFVALLVKHIPINIALKNLLITGFLGSFTTFSAFSLDSFEMFQKGLWIEALMYCIISVSLCIALTWIGFLLAEKITS